MKGIGFVLLVVLMAASSCGDEEFEIDRTEILTSRTWNRPQILHVPVNLGVYTQTSCDQSYRFFANNAYSMSDGCTGTISGMWSWQKDAEQLARPRREYAGEITPGLKNLPAKR